MVKDKYLKIIEGMPRQFSNDNALLKIITEKEIIDHWSNERRKQLKKDNLPTEWAEIGVLINDPFFTIVRDLVQFPDGSMNGYSRVIGDSNEASGKGIVILPVYKEKILVLHQYRHPTRSWHFEFPRGFGEPNVSAKDNAHKEINEEIQGEISELVDLGEYFSNTGFEGGSVSLFLAKLSSVGEPNRNEGIEGLIWLDVTTLEEWIKTGKISDGFTIAAYARAKLRKLI